MKIPINENWRIATDPQNFMIQKKTIVTEGKTKGEIKWVTMGFYTNLSQALRGYSRRFMLDGDETTLEALNTSLCKLSDEIQGVKATLAP